MRATVALLVVVLCLLGMGSSYHGGEYIPVLLVVAVIVMLARAVTSSSKTPVLKR